MPRPRVRKQIVCPECGRVLKTVPVPTAVLDPEYVPGDDNGENGKSLVAHGDASSKVEVVIEEGPVCPRCAAA